MFSAWLSTCPDTGERSTAASTRRKRPSKSGGSGLFATSTGQWAMRTRVFIEEPSTSSVSGRRRRPVMMISWAWAASAARESSRGGEPRRRPRLIVSEDSGSSSAFRRASASAWARGGGSAEKPGSPWVGECSTCTTCNSRADSASATCTATSRLRAPRLPRSVPTTMLRYGVVTAAPCSYTEAPLPRPDLAARRASRRRSAAIRSSATSSWFTCCIAAARLGWTPSIARCIACATLR